MRRLNLMLTERQCHKQMICKREFLEWMEWSSVLWKALESVIEPYYPRYRLRHPTDGLDRVLRLYFLQYGFSLGNEATKKLLDDIPVFAAFVEVDAAREWGPDASTLWRFPRLLEGQRLTEVLLDRIDIRLAEGGLLLIKWGSVVNITIFQAPRSTKNLDKTRNLQMCSAKKGNQCYFALKLPIGTNFQAGLVNILKTISAGLVDIRAGPQLLHGDERSAFADAGYQGIEKGLEGEDHGSSGFVGQHRSKIWKLQEELGASEVVETLGRLIAKVHASVEHLFHITKCRFSYRKLRCWGQAKSTLHLSTQFRLTRLLLEEWVCQGRLHFAGSTSVGGSGGQYGSRSQWKRKVSVSLVL